jgi:hypothetical protein
VRSPFVETAKSAEWPPGCLEVIAKHPLPFRDGSVEVVEAPGPPATVKLAGAGSSGKTAPMPVMGEPPAKGELMVPAPPTMPFAGMTTGTRMVRIPDMNVNNYASFLAELAVAPERLGTILARYGVRNETEHQALDAHWQRLLKADAGLRATFEQLLEQYTAWLRRRGGMP